MEDPAGGGVGAVSTCGTMIHHVGGVFVSTCTDPFGGAAGHGACNRSADLAAFLASAARKERQRLEAIGIEAEIGAQRRLQRIARAEGIAQTSFPRPHRRRLPRRTNPLPDIGQPHNGWVATRRTVSSADAVAVMDADWTARIFLEVHDEIPGEPAHSGSSWRRRRRHGRRRCRRCGIHPGRCA